MSAVATRRTRRHAPGGPGRRGVLGWLGRAMSAVVFALVLALFMAPGLARADEGRAVGWDVDSASRAVLIGKVELRYDPALESEAAWLQERIPGWWDDIEQKLGADVDDELKIHFVTHAGRVADATGMPYWAGGVANSRRGEIVFSRHQPDGSRANLENLLRHELVHVALYRATNGADMPQWFNEGVADSVGDEISLLRAEALATAVFGTGVPALDDLPKSFRGERNEVTMAYAASRDFATYLRYYDASEGKGSAGSAFRGLIDDLGNGRAFDAAVVRNYDTTVEELESQWRKGLFGRFVWYPLLGSGGLPFLLVTPVVLIAWIKRRRERAQDWARMERQEQAEAQLRQAALGTA